MQALFYIFDKGQPSLTVTKAVIRNATYLLRALFVKLEAKDDAGLPGGNKIQAIFLWGSLGESNKII